MIKCVKSFTKIYKTCIYLVISVEELDDVVCGHEDVSETLPYSLELVLGVVENSISIEVRSNFITHHTFESCTQNERKACWLVVIGGLLPSVMIGVILGPTTLLFQKSTSGVAPLIQFYCPKNLRILVDWLYVHICDVCNIH